MTITVVISVFFALSHVDDRRVLQTNLKLSELPPSVSDVTCSSGPPTDVLTDCEFNIRATDFPTLLNGWTFTRERSSKTDHTLRCPSWGPVSFPVAFLYEADISANQEFRYGGHFAVCANMDYTHVHTTLYIE